ncbi:aquaporin, partial [Escherichia coli]|uniref:aquaporin n=1 Tax=Escherichia coli TaxID=562 RepID=UPI003C781CEA
STSKTPSYTKSVSWQHHHTSVNPARSTAVAIFQGGWALEQLWFFWVVPIVGGIIGGLIYRTLLEKRD